MSDPENNSGNQGGNTTQQSGTYAKIPFKPKMPKFGGLKLINDSEEAAWLGGKPNDTWTGLENPNPSHVKPTQFRSNSMTSEAKSRSYRIAGITPKFKRGDDVSTFARKFLNRAEDYGLDTIMYVPSPRDKTGKTLVNVLESHGLFRLDEGITAGQDVSQHYDSYCNGTDDDAKQLLLNSVDPALETQLYQDTGAKDGFIVTWFHFISNVTSKSINKYNSIVDKLRKKSLADYEGQDVEALAESYRHDYDILNGACQYDHKLTLHMVETFMEGGGSRNDDFKHPLRKIKDKLEEHVLSIHHMTYNEQHEHMVKEQLDVRTVLREIKDEYRNLYDNNKWEPAQHVKDPKKLDRGYGKVNVALTQELRNVVHQLVQNSLPKKSIKDKNDRRSNGRNGQRKTSFRNPKKQGSNRDKGPRQGPSPPKPGEPEIKMMDGKKRYWCAKCNRWTLSHPTATHKSKEELKNESSPAAKTARVSFDFHPSAFMIKAKSCTNDVNTLSAPKVPKLSLDLWNKSNLSLVLILSLSIIMALTQGNGFLPADTMYASLIAFVTSLRPSQVQWTLVANFAILLTGCVYSYVPIMSQWKIRVASNDSHAVPARKRNLSPNRRKQQHRRRKKWHLSNKGSRRPKPIQPQLRQHKLMYRGGGVRPHKYNRTGRVKNMGLPISDRIRILKLRIANTNSRINELAQEHVELKEIRRLLQSSLDELKGQAQQVDAKHAQKNRTLRRSSSPAAISSLPLATRGTPVLSTFYAANLINLSKITSARREAGPASPTKGKVLFDSGANCCITNCLTDFVGPITKQGINASVDGLDKALKIEGEGNVGWTFIANNGMYRTIKVPCYYVPKCATRIASTSRVLQAYPKEHFLIKDNKLMLSGHKNTPGITVSLCPDTGLPFAETAHVARSQAESAHSAQTHSSRSYAAEATRSSVTTSSTRDSSRQDNYPKKHHSALTTADNHNLSPAEKELLRWHHRLGHVRIRRIQWLFRQGVLGTNERTRRLQAAASKLTHGPLCTACQYAKQRRTTEPGKTTSTVPETVGIQSANNLFPGQEISVDHFQCNPLGRLINTYGKEATDKKYRGGCIFVDHASRWIHVELQSRLNSHQTLQGKRRFETICGNYGVIPQQYLSDNGAAFQSDEFTTHLERFHQTIRHSAVGAHHSNGIAESMIGAIMSISRAMLHHSALHWPDVADINLWPLAILHAVHIHNHLPRESTGRSPYELFSRKTWSPSKFHDFHVWGCPVYVLDSTLSGGNKLPRWRPRSARCMYVGHSLKHGHSIPLVLDLSTGAITPQYHVVFDDEFQTVTSAASHTIDFDSDDWYKTFGLTAQQYIPPDDDDNTPLTSSEGAPSPSPESEGALSQERLRGIRDTVTRPVPLLSPTQEPLSRPLPVSPAQPDDRNDSSLQEPSQVAPPQLEPAQLARVQREDTQATEVQQSPSTGPKPSTSSTPPPVATSSPSPQVPPRRDLPRAPTPPRRMTTRSMAPMRTRSQQTRPSSSALHIDASPTATKAKARSDPDTFDWEQAMASEHRAEFLKAAQAEIDALTAKRTWVEDLKSNATTRIVPMQWVFRIKRSPDGTIKRWKARACLRGDRMEDSGTDNYSPVAAWSTVRTFLVTSAARGWVTTSIDFSNAFVQSDLPDDEPVWMHVPRGFTSTLGNEYCLRLRKSLYGHKRAPQLWFNHSSDAFRKLGLTQSEHDQCLWYGQDIMLVQYVDDVGIAAASQQHIDDLVLRLRNLGFELTQEESFEEFLGIKFNKLADGSIECTQKGLIKKTLEAAGMMDCNPNSTPATQVALGADKDGPDFDERWNYRGICGMLLYLSTNTRPDISYAVSQVCRFGHNPKKSHASAVKTILRYLKKTQDKGLIVKPWNQQVNLDLYVDADFCGLFGREDPRDVNSVRSRTGYIVILCGWPIIWKSQLQTCLSQSTLEAEYTALSSALKVFLPLKWLTQEMIDRTASKPLNKVQLHATVFEDNQSAYYLATNQRITSRTKYFLAKWHWFWSHVNNGEFTIVKCPTNEQRSDYLTKSLPKETFERNRKDVQGW